MAEQLIDIGKIVRNTTKMSVKNGEMEEMVNMRNDEGVWKPMPENVKIWNELISNGNNIHTKFPFLFIHTGKYYKHLLGVNKDTYGVFYIGDIANDSVTLCNGSDGYDTGVTVYQYNVQVHQVGNLIIINDTNKVHYILFKNNEYVKKSIDPNELNKDGFLDPEGLNLLRVVPTTDSEGVPLIQVTSGDMGTSTYQSYSAYENEIAEIGQSMITQARSVAKAKGLINGFRIGVIAYRLYDGVGFAYASRPILLPQPNDEGTRYEKEYGFEDVARIGCFNSNGNYGGMSPYINKSAKYQKDMQPLSLNGKNFGFRYNPKAMEVVWQKSAAYSPKHEYSKNSRAYYWNSNIQETIPTNDDTNIERFVKDNCEIYWQGDEQGHNLGERFKSSEVQAGSDGGFVSSGSIPLYERDESKESGGGEHVPLGFPQFSMAIRGSLSRYQNTFSELDSSVTIRGSVMQEITAPIDARLNTGKRDFEVHRGCDCFNPPNCFAVVNLEARNGDDTVHNYMSSARKVGDKDQAYGFTMTNNLQIMLGNVNKEYFDIIQDVCVFLSSEIYYADENKGDMVKVGLTDIERVGSNTSDSSRSIKQCGSTVYANPKDNEKLVNDIVETQVLYNVWSKPYKNIEPNKWIDIDLSDCLNILEERETLNVDSVSGRNGLSAKCSYLYNGRLHLGNIEETYFDGYPYNSFEITEQWKQEVVTNYSRSLCCAYDFRDSTGKDTIAPAFNRIGTGQADMYIGFKATESESEYNGTTHTVLTVSDTNPVIFQKNGEDWMYVRYVDSDTGRYYTIGKNDERIDIDNTLYYEVVDGVWTQVTKYVMSIGNDDEPELIVFVYKGKVVNNTYNYRHDIDKIASTEDRYYSHHKAENKGFWQKLSEFPVIGNLVQGIKAVSMNASPYQLYRIIHDSDWTVTNPLSPFIESNEATFQAVWQSRNQSYDHETAADSYFATRMSGMMYWGYEVCKQWDDSYFYFNGTSWAKDVTNPSNVKVYIAYEIDTTEGKRIVGRIYNTSKTRMLNPMISYPDIRANKVRIGWIDETNDTVHEVSYKMRQFSGLAVSTYVSNDVKPIHWWDDETMVTKSIDSDDILENENASVISKDSNGHYDIKRINTVEDRRNVMKVSSVENPLVFPAEYTYQIGNGEILAIMANTVALSEGQFGDAPLYVFCTDGIYGLFVDSTGQMCYSNSRPISRDVCNNSLGVLPIDTAVVYPTSRGLFMISGANSAEISKTAEGEPLKFADNTNHEYLHSMNLLLNNDAWLHIESAPTDEDFKEYIKNAVCGWNYKHTELWVSNPESKYTYVYSNGGWTKIMRQIEYYINDYPRTYAIEIVNGNRCVIDIEETMDTPTDCFFITRPIVINGEIAKTFTKAWMYADLDVEPNGATVPKNKHKASILVYGSHDGYKYGLIGIGGAKGKVRNIVAKLHRMSMRYVRIAFAGKLKRDSIIECLGIDVTTSWGEESAVKVR